MKHQARQNKKQVSVHMADRKNSVLYPKPLIDQPGAGLKTTRFLLLAFVLVAVIAYGTLFPGADQNALILGILSILVIIGVFFIFAAAIGFVGLTNRSATNDFAKAYIDGVEEGLVVTDSDSRVVYANAAYGELIGATQAKDIRTVERIFSKDPDAAEVVYRLAHAVRAGNSDQDEIRLAQPVSSILGSENASAQEKGARWYRLRVRPFSLDGQKAGLAAWQVQDITRDRNHQERMFQNLQYAIDYLDHAPAGFFSANADGSIVYINATLADWLQLDLTRFAPGALNVRDLMIGDGAALLSTVKPKPGETRTATIDLDLARADGMSLPVRLFHMVPVANDGAPGATRTIVLNRSEEIDGMDAGSSRAAELRFNRFFNSTPIAIASLDANGTVQRSNAGFLNLFNRPDAEISVSEGKSFPDAISQAKREEFLTMLKRAVSGYSTTEPIDVSLSADKNRLLRIYVTGVGANDNKTGQSGDVPKANEDGLHEAAIIYAVEMTEQRALEEQFAKGQKMQAVGQLAGGIAHDFNNVLTGIIGFSDLLLTKHRPSDPSFTDIMAIKQNANKAAGLVRQLLAFSRRQTLQPEVLQVPDQLDEVSMLLKRLLGEKITLDITHERDLWPIKADVSQFEQVVVNLAVNARDAMGEGGRVDHLHPQHDPKPVGKPWSQGTGACRLCGGISCRYRHRHER
jgi:two-component system cell cycle sensor histidine kinase/response regulator CckA